jgi:hypothetical protein
LTEYYKSYSIAELIQGRAGLRLQLPIPILVVVNYQSPNQVCMDWLLMIIGILIVLLGLVIWRFRLVNLLSNVEGLRVIDKEKAARYTACYLAILGVCFMTLGYFIEELSKRNLILIIACFIPFNLVVLIPYMVAQSRNMK